MAGINEVLERLVNDPSFKQQLSRDAKNALAAYELTTEDLRLLVSQISSDKGGQSAVEARTSRSALFSLLGQLGNTHGFAVLDSDGHDLDKWTGQLDPGQLSGLHGGAALDSDGDLLPDWYEEKVGLNPDNPRSEPGAWGPHFGYDPDAVSASHLDSDGDGLDDLEELHAGTDPFVWDPPVVVAAADDARLAPGGVSSVPPPPEPEPGPGPVGPGSDVMIGDINETPADQAGSGPGTPGEDERIIIQSQPDPQEAASGPGAPDQNQPDPEEASSKTDAPGEERGFDPQPDSPGDPEPPR